MTDLLTVISSTGSGTCCLAWARKATADIANYDHPNGFTQPTAENWISFMVGVFPLIVGDTYYETLDATCVAIAGMTQVPIHVQALAAVAAPVAIILRQMYVTLAATAEGVAVLTKKMYVTLSATAIGVATLLGVVVSLVSLQAVAVGVAVLTAVPTFAKTLAATAVCQAVLSTVVTWYRTLTATAIGQAVLSTVATYYRTLSATAVGVAGIVATKLVFVTMAATAIGVAGLAVAKLFTRTLTAVQVGIAAIGTFFIPGEEPPETRDDIPRRDKRRWLRTFGRWRRGHR